MILVRGETYRYSRFDLILCIDSPVKFVGLSRPIFYNSSFIGPPTFGQKGSYKITPVVSSQSTVFFETALRISLTYCMKVVHLKIWKPTWLFFWKNINPGFWGTKCLKTVFFSKMVQMIFYHFSHNHRGKWGTSFEADCYF